MSSIPNSAIPHAVDHDAAADADTASDDIARAKAALGGLIQGVEDFAREVGERIRAAPKGAQIAAGALAVGGLVAAAAVPLVRAARKPSASAKPRRAPAKPKTATAAKPKTSAAAKPKATTSAAKPKAATRTPRAATARKPKSDAPA